MKLKNLIIICLAVVMGLMAVGCDQESDVGVDKLVNSVVAIGFNIDMKLPSYNNFQAANSDVTSDWISDATMDIIDAIWIVYHDGTTDVNKKSHLAPALKEIKADNHNGTGKIYAGIANASLASENGLTLDVMPVKYKKKYDSNVAEKDKEVYYLGNLREFIRIDQNITAGYNKIFDVTVDGIYSSLDISVPPPNANH